MWICEEGSHCVDGCEGCPKYIEVREVIHATWVQKEFWPNGGTWRCSNCERQIMFMTDTPETQQMLFCPGCGARMNVEAAE